MKAYSAGPDTNGLIVAICLAFNSEEARFFRGAKCRLWPILLQKSFCTDGQKFAGRRCDFRVKMWGASSPHVKLTGDLANASEAIHKSAIASIFVISRIISRPATFDFCNSIGP